MYLCKMQALYLYILTNYKKDVTVYRSFGKQRIKWISNNNSEPPETMTKQLTNVRKICMSKFLFVTGCNLCDVL